MSAYPSNDVLYNWVQTAKQADPDVTVASLFREVKQKMPTWSVSKKRLRLVARLPQPNAAIVWGHALEPCNREDLNTALCLCLVDSVDTHRVTRNGGICSVNYMPPDPSHAEAAYLDVAVYGYIVTRQDRVQTASNTVNRALQYLVQGQLATLTINGLQGRRSPLIEDVKRLIRQLQEGRKPCHDRGRKAHFCLGSLVCYDVAKELELERMEWSQGVAAQGSASVPTPSSDITMNHPLLPPTLVKDIHDAELKALRKELRGSARAAQRSYRSGSKYETCATNGLLPGELGYEEVDSMRWLGNVLVFRMADGGQGFENIEPKELDSHISDAVMGCFNPQREADIFALDSPILHRTPSDGPSIGNLYAAVLAHLKHAAERRERRELTNEEACDADKLAAESTLRERLGDHSSDEPIFRRSLKLAAAALLRLFGLDFEMVQLLLLAVPVVITGSAVTSLVHNGPDFLPNDLDFFAALGEGYVVVELMRLAGYTVDREARCYGTANHIRIIWWLSKPSSP
ncbi:hypothetical protein R3P38DRAFT_2800192 [Favolaschia claudopus]|uniref:Uncharacterized protein n=1 Tax=Favolaschia claudopus TaxID=2862362 RepID=A0AAV9ZZ19_9AGAR